MSPSDEARKFTKALDELDALPSYERTQPVHSKRQWVEDEYERLQVLIEQKGYPFHAAARVLGNSISGSALSKHYRSIRKVREKAKRERLREQKAQTQPQLEDVPKIRHIDPSTVKFPPPLVHAEVVED